jgi:catechol 2,3-dioxygenase-like lactoylglutathione lyase family enzyme
MDTPTFSTIRTVAVPVSDQDRSIELLEALGFTKTMDRELQPGFPWIELTLPDGGSTRSLVRTGEHLPTAVDTGIRLTAADARGARAAVEAAGLDATDLLDWDGLPLMFSFVDHDGNRFYVSETS